MEIAKDIGEEIIEGLRELNCVIKTFKNERVEYEMNFPKCPSIIGEKMNSQVHLVMETSLHKFLKEEANLRHLSLNDYCKRRLRGVY